MIEGYFKSNRIVDMNHLGLSSTAGEGLDPVNRVAEILKQLARLQRESLETRERVGHVLGGTDASDNLHGGAQAAGASFFKERALVLN